LLPPIALYRADGSQSGLPSRKGTKLCRPTPSQMMLFCFEPLDHVAVDQQLPSRADVDRLAGPGRRREEDGGRQEACGEEGWLACHGRGFR
jgi:hypothetical protein